MATWYRVRRLASALLLPLYLQACVQWQPITPTPETLERADLIRVATDSAQRPVLLREPRVSGDSLYGARVRMRGGHLTRVPGEYGRPLSEVTRVDVQRQATGAVVAVTVLVGALVMVVLACGTSRSCGPSGPTVGY